MGESDPRWSAEHKRRRAELLPDAFNTSCPRCGELMLKGQELELGHLVDLADDPTPRPGDRIEHARCNEKAGAEAQQRRRKYAPSRAW